MEKFEDLIQRNIPVLVDYFAIWCGPCKMMHPVLEELKRQLGDRIKILKPIGTSHLTFCDSPLILQGELPHDLFVRAEH